MHARDYQGYGMENCLLYRRDSLRKEIFFLSTFIIELLCIPVCCCLVNRAAGTSFTCAKNMWVLMLFSSHKREMKGVFCPPSRGND